MRNEIEQSLQQEADTVSQDIDKMMFERLQNAQTWSHLEVMQDIRIKDVDKRLSKFLAELKYGYRDVYHELLCTDGNGTILASSDPSHIDAKRSVKDTGILIGNAHSMLRLEPIQLSETGAGDALPIKAGVPSMFNNGDIGNLYLMFNWNQIYLILDQAAQGGRELALLDGEGRIVAASAGLRTRGVLMQKIPSTWITKDNKGIKVAKGAPIYQNEITVAFDRSTGFEQFPGFGWTTIVIENSRLAYIPVQQMALLFLLLLAVTSTVAVSVSMLVAGRISRPISALTELTRRFKQDKKLPQNPQPGAGEVGELTEAFVQTVHDLDQSRADLVRASKLAVLGELAAVMSHEIRTPIGILRSSAQMLAREPNLSQEARELTEFIESETERLKRLVSTLLDSARPRAPQLQLSDIHVVIRRSINLLNAQAAKKQISIHSHLQCQNPVIPCDVEQMTQVLLNLILNALQILAEGGRVDISTLQKGDNFVLEIADDGPGIPDGELARVFDPFFTKREGGVGLGLAVVQQIITAHGGTVNVGRSTLGGALFSITLPMKERS